MNLESEPQNYPVRVWFLNNVTLGCFGEFWLQTSFGYQTTFGKQFAFGLDCKKNVFQILFYRKLVSEGSKGPLPFVSVWV